jgi:hypothetical protein
LSRWLRRRDPATDVLERLTQTGSGCGLVLSGGRCGTVSIIDVISGRAKPTSHGGAPALSERAGACGLTEAWTPS